MSETWNLKGGAIVIGSLLWQDHLRDKPNARKDWRDNRVREESKILVKLPIRYGRYSEDGIYTMVFSNNCYRYRQLGTGYVLPFEANPIRNFRQLLSEAEEMSEAEGMRGGFWGGERGIWGKMGILFNDSRINKRTKKSILSCWQEQFRTDDGRLILCDFKLVGNERPCVTNKGELTIKWVESVNRGWLNQVSKFDFLIATANMPKHEKEEKKGYPSVQEIATSVKKDKERFYFIRNVESGITTFQDDEILKSQ